MSLGHAVWRATVACLLLIGVVGCADMNTVKNAPLDQGIAQDFDATYDHTTAMTLAALTSLNVSITSSSEDAAGTTYLVSKSLSAWSWGEVGRVFVKRQPAAPTTVVVNWQKRLQSQLSGTGSDEFAQALFNAIKKQL